MTATVKQVIDLALSKVGYEYDTVSPYRWTGERHFFDCSGFMYYLPHTLGVAPSWWWPPGSHDQALAMRDHGLLIAPRDFHDGWGLVGNPDVARGIPGALVTHGPDHSYVGGSGIPGHIAMSLGNGKTVEAMGHAWGTVIGNFDGRNWNNAGFMPGIDYRNAAAPGATPAPIGGRQLSGDDMQVVIPARAAVVKGRVPQYVLNTQDDTVLCYNGATLKWRGPADDDPSQHSTGHGTGTDAHISYPIPTAGPHFGMEETKNRVTLLPDNVLVVTDSHGGCAFADMHFQGH